MNPRERILTVIKHEIPDQIPAHALNIDDIRPYLKYLNLKDKYELADYFGMCIKRVWPDYSEPAVESDLIPLFDDAKPLTPFGTSGTGGGYNKSTNVLRTFENTEDVKEIEQYNWPDINKWDFSPVKKRIEEYKGKYAIMVGSWNPIVCQLFDFFGMENCMVNMYLNPQVIEATLAHIENFYLEYYRRYFEATAGKADIFSMGDDFATQRGIMISPEHWRKYLKPTYKKIFELAKSYDLYVWFHACGTFKEVMPDLIDIGMDVWETVQAHLPGNEPEYIKKEYGKHITFYGAINTQHTLPFGTENQVRAEVRERIDILGENGGYICGPDHHIKSMVPVENTIAMYDEIRKYNGK